MEVGISLDNLLPFLHSCACNKGLKSNSRKKIGPQIQLLHAQLRPLQQLCGFLSSWAEAAGTFAVRKSNQKVFYLDHN